MKMYHFSQFIFIIMYSFTAVCALHHLMCVLKVAVWNHLPFLHICDPGAQNQS